MKDFFISYTSADLQWAEWIAWQLSDAGYTVVFQEWDFHAGGNFVHEMHRAAKETSRTLAVLSLRYLEAFFTKAEWAAAFVKDPDGKKRFLVPVRIEDFQPDGLFSGLTFIDLIGLSENDAKSRLLRKIEATITGGSVKPRARTVFPGKSPFQTTKDPRYPGTLPSIWNVPRRNPSFTGRDEKLEELRGSLSKGVTQQVLCGLGGIGKTQLAIEYAYRNSAAYDLVWWIRSEDMATLISDFVDLAKILDLKKTEIVDQFEDQTVIIRFVRQWLNKRNNWLLVFDNAANPITLSPYLPDASSGHVMVTSRARNWWGLFHPPQHIDVWNREESVNFLLKRSQTIDHNEANELAKVLGDLPLALEQAAAYIDARRITIVTYLDRFNTRHKDFWNDGEGSIDHEQSVAATFELSIEEIVKIEPLAGVVLKLCAVVAPDEIPRKLISTCGKYLSNQDGKCLQDDIVRDDAIGALNTYSLILAEPETLSVHQLVQVVTVDQMPREVSFYRKAVVKAINELFPDDVYNNPDCWTQCRALLPHAQAVVSTIENDEDVWKEIAQVLSRMGLYLLGRAVYKEAEELLHRAFKIRKQRLGNNNPEVAYSMKNFGLSLYKQGKLHKAEPLYRKSLEIYKTCPESNHIGLAQAMNDLGFLLHAQKKYAEGEELMINALAFNERKLGNDDPIVATSLNILAEFLRVQDRYSEAEPILRRALKIRRKKLGKDHPSVAQALNDLGLLLHAAGKDAVAVKLLRQALKIKAAKLDEKHPTVATSLNDLALVLQSQHKYTEAEPLFRRALEIREVMLGHNHPKTIVCRNNLRLLKNEMQ